MTASVRVLFVYVLVYRLLHIIIITILTLTSEIVWQKCIQENVKYV